jgi:hypothetical protein
MCLGLFLSEQHNMNPLQIDQFISVHLWNMDRLAVNYGSIEFANFSHGINNGVKSDLVVPNFTLNPFTPTPVFAHHGKGITRNERRIGFLRGSGAAARGGP